MAENHVRMAAHLYEARDTARDLHGAQFDNRMAEFGAAIREVAKRKGITEEQAGIQLAKAAQDDGRPYTAVTVMGALCELLDPSPRTEGC